MRVGAATLAAGLLALVGTLCFFLAFGTDYWLVASDNCGPYTVPTQTKPIEDGTEVGRMPVCGYCVFTNTKACRADCCQNAQ